MLSPMYSKILSAETMESRMTASEAYDAAVEMTRSQIDHACDGPRTCFVLIGRAMDLVAKGADAGVVGEALQSVLQDHGYLTEGCNDTYDSGS